MAEATATSRYWVTEEKVAEAVDRLIRAADPLAIIAFGSRARGTHRPESDLDLAVILDVPDEDESKVIPPDIFAGLRMAVDLLPVARSHYELMRPWLNSVYRNIDQEGIRLYERGQSPDRNAIAQVSAGRSDASVSGSLGDLPVSRTAVNREAA